MTENKIEEYAKCLKIIAEETNVKEVSFKVADTEKGPLTLSYFIVDDFIRLKLGNNIVWSKGLEKIACMFLDKLFSIKIKK